MAKLITNISIEEISNNKDPEVLKKYLASIYSMELYTYNSNFEVQRIEKNFEEIGQNYLSKMTYNYKDRIKRLNEAINNNQKFLNKVIKLYKPDESYYKNVTIDELNKYELEMAGYLNYAIFQYIARDWSDNNIKEREIHYLPIIKEVQKYVKPGSNILIPGASLCRLGYELASLGYNIDSNDYNFFNIILSDYIFNHSKKEMHSFQPLIRSFSNFLKEETVFKTYNFPDVDINLERKGKMTMKYGNFTTMYQDQKEVYDCIVTCFFIDTAKNIIQYIEIIERMLKKGGIWINFGPLSYHFAECQDTLSIELPYDKLKEVIINYGFEYLFEDTSRTVIYCEIPDYLKNDYFGCVFFSAKKK